METVNLSVLIRQEPTKAQNKSLKREGYVLGNISVRGAASVAIAVNKDEFRRALKLSQDKRFKLEADEATYNVQLKDFHMAHADVELEHVDFQLV